MKDLAWCTDIHLDFLDRAEDDGRIEAELIDPINGSGCSGVMITGDISIAGSLCGHLALLDSKINKPIYFVLGNHDFYGGSFASVRNNVVELCRRSKNLNYLTSCGPVSLTKRVGLVGHDGWYDGYYGDPMASGFLMSDWIRILDFLNAGAVALGPIASRPNMGTVLALARHQASAAAESVLENGRLAAKKHPTVIVLTHVPPFPELHVPHNKSSSIHGLPWYTSKLMGDALRQLAQEFPDTRFEVFSGHTHSQNSARIMSNLTCHVGGAVYDRPNVTGVIKVG